MQPESLLTPPHLELGRVETEPIGENMPLGQLQIIAFRWRDRCRIGSALSDQWAELVHG
jgi:hypothetical protein